jgi:hypothetical protein
MDIRSISHSLGRRCLCNPCFVSSGIHIWTSETMANITNPAINMRVRATNVRPFQGHIGSYPNPGTIVYVSPNKLSVEVLFDGEQDALWFRVDELGLEE